MYILYNIGRLSYICWNQWAEMFLWTLLGDGGGEGCYITYNIHLIKQTLGVTRIVKKKVQTNLSKSVSS